jgi:hypothetical protein
MKFLIAVLAISSLAQAQRVPTTQNIPLNKNVSEGIYESLALKQTPVKKPLMLEVEVPGLLLCRKYEMTLPLFRCFLLAGGWQSDAETVEAGIGYFELAKKDDMMRLYDVLGSAAVHTTTEHSGEDNSTLQIYSKAFKFCSGVKKNELTSLEVTYVQVENEFGKFTHDGYFVDVRNLVPGPVEACP